jgi:intracellular septation protein
MERNETLVSAVAGWPGRTVDAADVWVGFRGVLWIASTVFGLAQVPLIMRNLISSGPVDAAAPTEPDTAP